MDYSYTVEVTWDGGDTESHNELVLQEVLDVVKSFLDEGAIAVRIVRD